MKEMAVVKRSVSFDPEVAAGIEEAASAEGISFSAWLNRAVVDKLKVYRGLVGVREWEAEHGPIPADMEAWAQETVEEIVSRHRRVRRR